MTENDPRLQEVLNAIYETPERPRCLCVPGGVEMYVARHRQFVVKRMSDTGNRHAPACPSYEPEAMQSGLGELLGEAVFEREPGKVELRVDFAWTRTTGRVEQGRRFVKPLRYDARSAAGFANALLLDTGAVAVPLHVVSAFMTPKERLTKERIVTNFGTDSWVWVTEERIPVLPKVGLC